VDAAEIRTLAGYLLGQLLQRNSSVEVGVRGVLRIANLMHHTAWVAWASLQLVDMADESGIDEARVAVEHAFPDLSHQERILQQAKEAYDSTRAGVGDAPAYQADIGDVETDAAIFEADLMREISDQRFRQLASRHRILNKVRNKVQSYLMMIEAGEEPVLPAAN
jgi:hypothetical protein